MIEFMMLPNVPPNAKASIPTKIKDKRRTNIIQRLIIAKVIFPVLIPKDSKLIALILNIITYVFLSYKYFMASANSSSFKS